MILIGHRGLPCLAPENSLEGFKLAAEAGLNWVEFDVQITQDNQLVLMHDDSIDRTTNGSGFVYTLTLKQLQSYALKTSDNLKININININIPTLSETLNLLHQLKLQANIELKLPECLAEAELSIIRSRLLDAFLGYLNSLDSLDSAWPKASPWPLISSFDHAILISIRKHHPLVPLGFLVEEPNMALLALAKEYAPASINANFSFLTQDFVKLASQHNIRVLAYTVNQVDQAKILRDWGVYGLFTDIGDKLNLNLA